MENMEIKASVGEEKKDMMISSINDPCKWLQEIFRAMLKCLGIHNPADNDPPLSTTDDDPPQLNILSLRSRPRRPGLGNSGDPQTNDTSS